MFSTLITARDSEQSKKGFDFNHRAHGVHRVFASLFRSYWLLVNLLLVNTRAIARSS